MDELDDEIDIARVQDILNTLDYHSKESPTQNKPKLIAFCATDMTNHAELDAYIEERLPSYMKPDQYVLLKSLPLSPHGKVDRRKLHACLHSGNSSRELTMPKTPVESRLCTMWQELLGIQAIGTTDGFFDLGGDSLLVVRAVAQIEREFEVNIDLAEFFEAPTIVKLARKIDELLLEQIMDLETTPV